MLIVAYIFLSAAIVIHAVHWVNGLLRQSRSVWNYDKHGLLALIMLLLIAVANAAYTLAPNLLPHSSAILRTLFGLGRTEGVLQLGVAGFYWVFVGLFSVIVLLKSKRTDHVETVKLPPGGLWTLWGYMALLVLLIGLIIWGIR